MTVIRTAGILRNTRTMQAKADHVMRPKLRELTELTGDSLDHRVAAGNIVLYIMFTAVQSVWNAKNALE